MSHETEEYLLCKHRKETKDLHLKTTALKKSAPVSDKKRRKEVLAEIERLEKELVDRHNIELCSLRNAHTGETSNENTDAQITCEHDQQASVPDIDQSDDQNVPSVHPTNGFSESGFSEEIKEEETEHAIAGGKLTRAQRRRNVKQTKLDERLAALKIDADKPYEVSARTTEKIKLKKILDDLNLKLVEVRSDGNCMYHSLIHQLQVNRKVWSVQDLRQKTADHMTTNPDEFLPFLAHLETGDPLTPSEFVQYCDDIAKTNAWGSQVELRAIATVLEWPILVLQSEGPEVRIGEEYFSAEKLPLTVVYHRHELSLGEHYNSVMPL